MKKILAILLTALLQCGYVQGGVIENHEFEEIKGSIIDGFYYHPNGLFSFKIPEKIIENCLDEPLITSDPHTNDISIFDDFGNFVKVALTLNSKISMDTYDYLFSDWCLPFRRRVEKEWLIDDKLIEIDGVGKSYFEIKYPHQEWPNGYLNIEDRNNVIRTSMQSFYGFHLLDLTIQISTKNPIDLKNYLSEEVSTQTCQEFYDSLIELRRSYTYVETGTQGVISDGSYYDSNGFISFEIPEIINKNYTEELSISSDNISKVIISDSHGNFMRVALTFSEFGMDSFDYLFSDCYLPFRRTIESDWLIEDKLIEIEAIGKSYFMITYPDQRPDAKSFHIEDRNNSIRGYLASMYKGYLLIVTIQTKAQNLKNLGGNLDEEFSSPSYQTLYDSLLELRKSCEIALLPR